MLANQQNSFFRLKSPVNRILFDLPLRALKILPRMPVCPAVDYFSCVKSSQSPNLANMTRRLRVGIVSIIIEA